MTHRNTEPFWTSPKTLTSSALTFRTQTSTHYCFYYRLSPYGTGGVSEMLTVCTVGSSKQTKRNAVFTLHHHFGLGRTMSFLNLFFIVLLFTRVTHISNPIFAKLHESAHNDLSIHKRSQEIVWRRLRMV